MFLYFQSCPVKIRYFGDVTGQKLRCYRHNAFLKRTTNCNCLFKPSLLCSSLVEVPWGGVPGNFSRSERKSSRLWQKCSEKCSVIATRLTWLLCPTLGHLRTRMPLKYEPWGFSYPYSKWCLFLGQELCETREHGQMQRDAWFLQFLPQKSTLLSKCYWQSLTSV